MIGYKGFKKDLTCRGFQYEIGKTHYMDPTRIRVARSGFHFCQYSSDVFKYYNGNTDLYARIKASGKIITDYSQSVTNEIIIEEF
jgi:hypothetical protein